LRAKPIARLPLRGLAQCGDDMRVAMDVRTIDDHFPGIGRYAYQLARAMARQKNRGELVLVSNPDSSNTRFNLAELTTEPHVRIVRTSAKPFTLREQLFYPRELRKLKPSVIHFPYVVMPYAAPRPVVLTIHDIIPILVPNFFSLRQRLLYRFSLRMALRAAAVIICVSEATRSDLNSFCRTDPSRLVVIHEGIEEGFRPCSSKEIESVRTAYALPEQYFFYLGSNKPHKNLPALIQACAQRNLSLPLVIAGSEDPRFSEARRQVEMLGLGDRVRFLGAVREESLPALYSGARAFVFPSLYEGFGMPPLEAMACGVPVACSNIPSLKETAGDAALFFDPGDCASIADALERILTDPSLRAELRACGLRRAAELSWDTAAQKTLDILTRVGGR
jgi:glycosyltransferase involved in cell wall biosynthesis